MKAWSTFALISGLLVTGTASADEGHFYLFVAKDEAPSQALVESAWKETQKVGSIVSSDESKKRIGAVYPRLFGGTHPEDKSTIEGDLRAGKAAYFASDFDLAEQHLARALTALYASPEVISSSNILSAKLADSAALRYTNALARKQPEAAAREQLQAFVVRFPSMSPSPTEHAPDVLAVYDAVKKQVSSSAGNVVVSVLPLDLERSGTCRMMMNGLEVASLPMPGPLPAPIGEHFIQVRCGLQTSWLQHISVAKGTVAVTVPLRAMVATRADTTSGGLVLVSPTEGDSSALVSAVSNAADFLGAIIVRPAPPAKVEFGRWNANVDAPVTFAAGHSSSTEVTGVTLVQSIAPHKSGSLSPWPFVVAGAGVAALVGGAIANNAYLDDRDAGAQDLDATPSVVLYAVGGALAVTGVVWLVLELTDSNDSAALSPGGPGSVVVHF